MLDYLRRGHRTFRLVFSFFSARIYRLGVLVHRPRLSETGSVSFLKLLILIWGLP